MGDTQEPFTSLDHYAGRQLNEASTLAQPTANSTANDDERLFYVPPALVAVLSVIYGSVSVIAVVGNLLVIIPPPK